MKDSSVIVQFLTEKHAGQTRKYTGQDYFRSHCCSVAGYVQHILPDYTLEMFFAALAHDVIEDCECNSDELTEMIGPLAASYVVLLTKWFPKGTKNAVNLYRHQLMVAPKEVRYIKCCDIIHNTSDIVRHDTNKSDYLSTKLLEIEAFKKKEPDYYPYDIAESQIRLMLWLTMVVNSRLTSDEMIKAQQTTLANLLVKCPPNFVLGNFLSCCLAHFDRLTLRHMITIVRGAAYRKNLDDESMTPEWTEFYKKSVEYSKQLDQESVWIGLPKLQ